MSVAAAAIVATVALAAAALAIAPLPAVLLLLGTLAWYAVPGIALARRFYGNHENPGVAWLVGPLWGYAISTVTLLALWVAGLHHPSVALLAPLPAWGLVRLLGPRQERLESPALTRRDAVAVFLVVALVPAMVGRPFSQVGKVLPEGVAYRAYFTADFIWARTVLVELAKGDQPPQNMFLRGESLNYYWLPHLLGAAEYRWNWSSLTTDRIPLVNGLGLGVIFAAFFYGFVRHFTRSAAAAAIGCTFAFVFVSVEATWYLFDQWQRGRPLAGILSMNVDGLTRWVLHSVIVDGLHRLLAYQVTHHAIAYGAALSALLAVVAARDPGDRAVAWVAGVLLGSALLFSSFSALMIGVAVAIAYAIRLLAARRLRAVPIVTLLAAIPIAMAVAASIGLGYVDAARGLVEFGLNPMAARNATLAVPLSFGLLLPAGILGLIAGAIMRRHGMLALGILLVVCFSFYFFVNVRDHQNVYVAWRAGHVAIITLGTLFGVLCEHLWTKGPFPQAALVVAAIVSALLAAPTAVLDLYTSQDISNRRRGPGFRWTVILSPSEMDGLTWIREHTSPDAIVQVEPFARGRDTWSYVPAFAERRMAAGLPISMVPLEKYERASARIRAIYQSTDASTMYDLASKERIDYLVVGRPERAAYPRAQPALEARPDLFVPVFNNDAMSIYRLRGVRR